ncbi:MAG: hypothetical protein ABW049_03250 [Spongiibacteraceae bacterium]
MKRVGQVLLVLIVVLVVAYYFLVDVLLKSAIEREGSKVLKAELNIGSVDFDLFPLGIALHEVQATNPSEPLHNLLTAERIASTFTIREILDHQIVADDVQLQGLRFNQPRARSGAIVGLTPPPTNSVASGGLPGLTLPDPQTLLAAEKARVQTELRQLQANLTQTRDSWRQRMQSLPDQAKVDSYQQRAQALRQGSAVQRVVGAEQLRRDVKTELDNINAMREQARADWQQAQEQLNFAKTLPQRELDRVLASAGLDRGGANGEIANLTQALLGGEFAPLIAQLKGLAGLPKGAGNKAAAAAPASIEPEWRVLARAITLDGQFDIGSQPLRFNGVVHNVTPQPQFWNVATDFALQAATAQPGTFTVSGTIDQRKVLSANLRLALNGFPVQQLPLSRGDTLAIELRRALLNVDGLLRMEGSQMEFNLFGLFKQAELAVTASDNPIAQTLLKALRTVNQFDLNLLMTGEVSAPKVQLRSSLDQILAAAVGDQVRAQVAQLAAQLQTQLQQQVQPELDAINQLGADFQAMQQSLLDRQDALQSLTSLSNL